MTELDCQTSHGYLGRDMVLINNAEAHAVR
jgi:hypothetical protein